METLSDIERDLRDRADCAERHGDRETHNEAVAALLRSIADRIEAARRREATTEKSSAVGNAAAIREALCDIVMLTMKVGYSIHGDVACGIIASKAKHALSAPARNCDVGTEDSITQFQEFCESHDCETCEYLRFKDRGERYACAIAWMDANAERGDLCHED